MRKKALSVLIIRQLMFRTKCTFLIWLFLAVLLKLKSNVLAGIDVMFPAESAEENVSEFETDSLEDYDAEEKIDYFGSKVIPINEIIQRRTSVKQNRTRTVTLKDLIRQLEFYEHLDRKEGLKKRLEQAKRKVTPFNNMPLKDIVNLAQEDYIEPAVKLLQKRLTDIFEKETKIELNALAVLGLDKVTAYTALLFLSAKNGCDLEQEEFYSSVYVIKCTEENRQIISEKHQEAANGLEITD